MERSEHSLGDFVLTSESDSRGMVGVNLRGVDDHPDIALPDLPTAAIRSDVRVFVGD